MESPKPKITVADLRSRFPDIASNTTERNRELQTRAVAADLRHQFCRPFINKLGKSFYKYY